MSIPIPMPRFPSRRFPGFRQFRMENEKFAVEMKTLYDFLHFLIHIRPFDVISNYNKTLLDIYMFKVENKNTTARYETCLKLKLKKKYTSRHFSKHFSTTRKQ